MSTRREFVKLLCAAPAAGIIVPEVLGVAPATKAECANASVVGLGKTLILSGIFDSIALQGPTLPETRLEDGGASAVWRLPRPRYMDAQFNLAHVDAVNWGKAAAMQGRRVALVDLGPASSILKAPIIYG